MPLTAFSREAGRELDLEQWLGLNGFAVENDPALSNVPGDLRSKAATDIECSSCGVLGATIVGRAHSRASGRAVGQGHFRFRGPDGSSLHNPLCDFFDEKKVTGSEYLINLASDRSDLTRAVRQLVCRGISAQLFSQRDMRDMRLWFLAEKTKHTFVMDITPEDLQWCADMDAVRSPGLAFAYSGFRPEHGSLPGYDWKRAAGLEWARRNGELCSLAARMRAPFHRLSVERPKKLAMQHFGQTVFDPSHLQSQYEAARSLAQFAGTYLFDGGPAKMPAALKRFPSEWGPTGHAMLALSSLLLFVSAWDLDDAASLFVQLRTSPAAEDLLAGNLIGLNPFHDFEAWRTIRAARLIKTQRTDARPVPQQVEEIALELQAQHRSWLAARAS